VRRARLSVKSIGVGPIAFVTSAAIAASPSLRRMRVISSASILLPDAYQFAVNGIEGPFNIPNHGAFAVRYHVRPRSRSQSHQVVLPPIGLHSNKLPRLFIIRSLLERFREQIQIISV
jgi:hypothetical protein